MSKDNGNISFSTCLQNDECCKTKQIWCLFIMGLLFWCYVYVFKCGSRDVYVCHCDDSTVSYTFVAFHQKWTIDCHAIVDALASGVSIPFQILLDVLVSWTALMILCFVVSGFSTQLHMIIAHLAKLWLFVKWCRVSLLYGNILCFKPVCDHLWPLVLTPDSIILTFYRKDFAQMFLRICWKDWHVQCKGKAEIRLFITLYTVCIWYIYITYSMYNVYITMYIHICIHISVCAYVYVFVCVYVYIYVCVCVHTQCM